MTWTRTAGYVLGAVLSFGVDLGGRMRICFIRQQQGEREYEHTMIAAVVGLRDMDATR